MKKSNLQVRVRESCAGNYWQYGINEGRKWHTQSSWLFRKKALVQQKAKALAKCLGIKYNPEIIKQHGC